MSREYRVAVVGLPDVGNAMREIWRRGIPVAELSCSPRNARAGKCFLSGERRWRSRSWTRTPSSA